MYIAGFMSSSELKKRRDAKIYQKYDVHPFKSLIMPFISMPVFICVYHAVNNTAILKSGKVFGVNLGDAMSTGILAGRWFAIVLFIFV